MAMDKKKQHDKEQKDEQEFNFIEEKVASRKKQRAKKFFLAVVITIVLAIIFAITVAIVLSLAQEPIYKIFGKNKEIIEFTSDDKGDNQDNTGDDNEKKGLSTDDDSQSTDESETETEAPPTVVNNTIAADLGDLKNIYSEVKKVAEDTGDSMVIVTSMKNDQDWFQNEIEVPNDTNGLIVGNNGVDILVLVNYDRVQGANTIKVSFNDNEEAEATLQSFDSELNLAIIAIPLESLSEEVKEGIEVISLGESSYLPVGTPIIAIGSPNGYMGSMDIGMVNSRSTSAYITDHEIELYHTDINYVEDGEGYIINLDGSIIGIITTQLNDNKDEDINTFIGITDIKSIIESLVNNESRAYLGITAIDVTKEVLDEFKLDSGIAVTSVEANSPAFYSGVQVGDIIISINDINITSVNNYQDKLLEAKPEDVIDIKLHREYQTTSDIIEVEAMLGTRQF